MAFNFSNISSRLTKFGCSPLTSKMKCVRILQHKCSFSSSGSNSIRILGLEKRYKSTDTNAFKFSKVIVSEIPDSYATGALGLSSKVDLDKAREQHKAYVSAMRSIGCGVVTMTADENFPDCVFVEDAAVVIDGHALLTQPGDPSRVGEVHNMRVVLEQEGLIVMKINDPKTKLDGGDVVFTGKEILVGLSERTNVAGVDAIKEAFPGYPVTVVPVFGPLHLTTMVTMCGPNTLCASSETGHSTKMLKHIQENSVHTYESLIVPHDKASNTVYMNGALLHKSKVEHRESAEKLIEFCEKSGIRSIELELSEIEKAVGSMTCMSKRYNITKSVGPVNPIPHGG